MTWELRAPLENPPPTLQELMTRAWPDASEEQLLALLDAGGVQIEDRISRDASRKVTAGDRVRFTPEAPGDLVFGIPEAEELARGDVWVLVDKPLGIPGNIVPDDPMHPVLFMSDMLGLDRDLFTPVWDVPATYQGPWLCANDPDAAQTLRDATGRGDVMLTYVALTTRLEMPRGQWTSPDGMLVTYSVTQFREGLCEVQLIPHFHDGIEVPPDPMNTLLALLASQGAPVLGDRTHGGFMVEGGLRMRLAVIMADELGFGHSWNPPEDGWWPEHPVVEYEAAPREDAPSRATSIAPLVVSDKTMEILNAGHPWVLVDGDLGSRDDMCAGQMVHLQTASGVAGPFALVDPAASEVAARVWSQDEEAARSKREEIDIRVDEALFRREDLLKDLARTNLFRLIHGEADGFPGLYLDRVGPMVRATLMARTALAFKDQVYTNLADFDPNVTIMEVAHFEDVRARGDELPRAEIVRQGAWSGDSERVIGLEDGLRYWCEPYEGIDVGFFADQRANRRTLCAMAKPGQNWLNLFGHTGAFSVALGACGARVTNVDISKRYLEWTAENFALNDIDPELNVGSSLDARAFVAQTEERYFGIIVDPPTAARSEHGFWSIRKDYQALLEACFERLEPGGVMLVCRNDRKKRGSLVSLVRQAARAAGFKVASISDASPGHDYPALRGFPEGDPFEGVLVQGAGA